MQASRQDSTGPGRARPAALAVALAIAAALPGVPESRADFELSAFNRGYGPNAGGTGLLGIKARLGWVEASVIQYEYGGTATSVGWRKPLRDEKAWIAPSVAMTARLWVDETAIGPGLGVAFAPVRFGRLAVGLRLDNDLLYLAVARQLMPEYLLGLTLVWN